MPTPFRSACERYSLTAALGAVPRGPAVAIEATPTHRIKAQNFRLIRPPQFPGLVAAILRLPIRRVKYSSRYHEFLTVSSVSLYSATQVPQKRICSSPLRLDVPMHLVACIPWAYRPTHRRINVSTANEPKVITAIWTRPFKRSV